MTCSCPDGCNGCEQEKDFYEHRHELKSGQVFECLDSSIIRLYRRVPGDGTKWYAEDWSGRYNHWYDEGGTIEPGDLKRQLPEMFGK
jgi:hypothetical protein